MAPRRRDVLKTSGVAGVAALVGGTRDGLGAAFAQTEQASSPTMRPLLLKIAPKLETECNHAFKTFRRVQKIS